MEYQIGDKVIIRKDLKADPEHMWQLIDRIGFIIFGGMERMAGREVTIASVGDRWYKILEDSGSYVWTWEMFEKSYEEES